MNVYFIYSAEMWDRSVGTVLFNEESFTEEEFKELVKVAKESTDGCERSIINYLVQHHKFVIANIPRCNIETVKIK